MVMLVTPFVGVWIETTNFCTCCYCSRSHPSWVCGLKPIGLNNADAVIKVTPFVGVWIETGQHMSNDMQRYVTPFVGVWIET